MKGLLRKDFYMIWKYCRMLLVMSVIFLATSAISSDNNFFFVIYPVLFAGVLPVTLLSYDERFGWNKTCDALPLTRKTVVSERYLMALLCFLIVYVLTLAVQAAVLLPAGRAEQLRQLAGILPGFGLMAPALLLPITLRWGVERGRLAFLILVGVIIAVGLVFFDEVLTMRGAVNTVGLAVTLLLVLLLFAGSWLLSIRIYERREL